MPEPAAQDLPLADPEEVGLSRERLDRIAPMIRRYIDDKLIPGAITLVARHGKVAHFETHGLQNVETGTPMAPDTIFRIASMTKPITSVALMMLYEEGRFQLRDPISKWLPEYGQMEVAVMRDDGDFDTVPAERAIDVRHVLTHTAGFVSDTNPAGPRPLRRLLRRAGRFASRHEVIGDFVKRLADVPLAHPPGEKWDYSRATDVVGHLVEVLSGQTLDEFFRERILGPLDMVDTHFFLPEEKASRFAAAYQPGQGGEIAVVDAGDEKSFYRSEPGKYFMGAGGLVSTSRDYFRFAQMLLDGGKLGDTRILSRKTVELMTRNHIGERHVWLSGPGRGFGLGFDVVLDRGRTHTMASEGSYSWGGAFCTYWWNDPAEGLHAQMLTQVRPYTHLNIRMDMQSLATASIVD